MCLPQSGSAVWLLLLCAWCGAFGVSAAGALSVCTCHCEERVLVLFSSVMVLEMVGQGSARL